MRELAELLESKDYDAKHSHCPLALDPTYAVYEVAKRLGHTFSSWPSMPVSSCVTVHIAMGLTYTVLLKQNSAIGSPYCVAVNFSYIV